MKLSLPLSVLFTLYFSLANAVPSVVSASPAEILFLDSGVDNKQALVSGVRSGIEVVLLDADRDGLLQIAEVLEDRRNLSGVHVVSHAKPGRLLLGGRIISRQEIENHPRVIKSFSKALSPGGDLLLYGCSLAEGGEGAAFVDALARYTGADVAASLNDTGSGQLGADWTLEFQSGVIDSLRVFTPSAEENYLSGTLAFSTGQFLTGTANTNNFSSQVIGPGGTIYGAWNYSGSGGTMKFATWNGSSWTEVPGSAITGATVAGQLTGLDNLNQLGTDSFKVDSNGDFHVALAISASSGGVASQRGLGYGFFDASTQTWTFRRLMIFSNPNGWNNLGNGGAVMLLDSSENPHIVYGWSDANAPRWEYVEHAYFNGTSWNVTGTTNAKDGDIIDSLSGGAEIFGLDGAVDSSGNIHITYAREDADKVSGDVWYVKRTGSAWGTPAEIINVDDFIYPTMALDTSDKVHVAWTIRPTNTSFEIKIATNASGSYVTSTVATDSEAGAAFQSAPFDLTLSINSLGNRFLSGSYSFSAGAPNYEIIRGALAVYTESSPGTWVREDVLTPTTSEGNFSYTSMAVKDDNTVSLLTGTRDDDYTTGNLKYAVGIPAALPAGPTNSAPSFNDGTTTTLTVNENGSATSINSLLDINDTDSGDSLTWSVTSGPSKGSLGGFPAGGTSNGGNVTPSGLIYTPTSNNTGNDSFTIQISDGTDTDSITVSVTISDVNPVITANSGSIAEDASINDPVLTMAATGDTNGLTWSITGGNTGNAFAINSSTGAIRVNSALDFETTPGYTLTVAVDDEDAGSTADDTESVTITVTNVNEAPTVSLGATGGNLAENNTPNNVITSITVNDDALGSETLSLSGTDAGSFQINGGNLEFTATADFEIKSSYSVTVNVDDSTIAGAPDDSATYNLTITDVNEAPTLTLGATSGNLNENNTPNNVVTSITVNDDALGSETLSLSGTDAGSFQINGGNLEFTASADFETKTSYSVTVEINDATVGGTPDDSDTFTLTITDANDPPTLDNAVSDFAVNEDAGDNTFDLTTIFSDVEDADSSLTYSVESNSNSSLVTATPDNGTDVLTLSYTGNTAGTATITVRATDSGTLFVEDTFIVTVNDVNPVITANSASIAEDAGISDSVLTMAATGDTNGLSWSITGGNTGSAFAINSSTGEVTVNSALDFETTPSYTLTIAVDDEDVDTAADDTESVTITITDVNDNPTLDNPVSDFAVNENAANSTFDLTDIFSDAEDADSTLTYSVESNSNTSLVSSIADNGTDVLTLSYSSNSTGTANVTVRATDSGTLFVEETFTVTVNDVDPLITANSGSIAEDAGMNDPVLTMAATGDTNGLTWSITGGNTGSAFAINSSTGAITVNSALDFETTTSFTLTIAVDDEDADTTADDTESVIITVTDVNEAPTLTLGGTSGNLAENNTPNNVVTSITVNDDGLGSETLSLSGTDAGSFQINGSNLEFTATADFETKSSYSVTVNIDDTLVGGSPDDSATFTLTITDVNEAPTLTLGATSGTLAENNTPDNVITSITVSDDALGSGDLSLSGADAGSFQMNAGNLEFTANADFETKSSYTVTVEVDDATVGGTPDDSATFTLTIIDVNDVPTVDNPVVDFAVNEDAPDSIFDLTDIFSDAEDVDSALTYSVESNSDSSLVTATVDNGTDLLTLDFLLNQYGSAEITVRATDSGTLFIEETFTVTVNAVNDTPTVSNAVADFGVIEDAADSTFDLTNIFSDIEDADSDLVYTVESNTNASLVGASVDAGTDILTLDFLADQTGTAELTVRATDSGTLFAEDTFTVTVTKQVDLTLTVSEDKDPVLAGNGLPGNLIHQIKVLNNGPSDATNLVVDFTQTLPTGVVLDSALPSSGTALSGTWNIPALAEGNMVTLTLTMSVPVTVAGGVDTIITASGINSITEPLVTPGDDSATVQTSVASPASTDFELETAITINFGNSLFEQLVSVTNNNPGPVPAFRILVDGLPDDVTLFNAHGETVAGQPFVVWNQELASLETAEVLMQFHRNSGLANFTPVYTIEFLSADEAALLLAPPPLGDTLSVTRFVELSDGGMLLEWASVPGKTYYVQYSSDMTTYTTVLPPITAGANRTQWIDRGPPQTESHPSTLTGIRFYRIKEAN